MLTSKQVNTQSIGPNSAKIHLNTRGGPDGRGDKTGGRKAT